MALVPALGLAAVVIVLLGKASDDDPKARSTATEPVRVAAKGAPVIVLELDEFNVDWIRKPDGNIDEVRFPNFARLARMSTWFPNAQAVFDETKWATPAVWDGLWPRRGTRPVLSDHPNNLMNWLGSRGYRIKYADPAGFLCAPRYCGRPRQRSKLYYLYYRRRERLRSWIRSIRPHKRPYLYALHEDLPHKPWVYLPSGRNDQRTYKEPVPRINSTKSFHLRYLTDHNRRRQQLQTGFVDKQLGYLLSRLRRNGLLHKAVIAVTADHGYAWELGVKDRRKVTSRNIDEVTTIPFFIKRPGQRKGEINNNFVRVIDLVPTIADVLNMKLNYRPDGRSAFGKAAQRRRTVRLRTRDFSRVVKISAAEMQQRRAANIRRWLAQFKTGAESVKLYGNRWESIYRYGPVSELIGRKVSELQVAKAGSLSVRIASKRLTHRRRRGSLLVHTHIAGRIDNGRPREERVVAASVNGTIFATGRSFHLLGESQETFSLLVPERAMRYGTNQVRIFAVSRRDGALVLTPIGSNS